MPTRIPWLTGVDRTLLEWLYERDVVFTPRLLHDNLERELPDPEAPSYSQVARRVRTLREAGLLDPYDDQRGKYTLSELAERLLEDDLADDEREELVRFDPDD